MKTTAERINDDVVLVSCYGGGSLNIFLASDEHHDSTHHQRKIYLSHLEKAQKKNALIISGGDFFDAMQSRFDQRKLQDELKSEYAGEDYTDRLVNEATNLLMPYRDNLLVMAQGNHELSALKNLGTNLTARLVWRLNQDRKNKTFVGGYDGLICFRFYEDDKRSHGTVKIKFLHGKWGGEVTKGVLGANRLATWNPDVDIVHIGHAHNFWYLPTSQERYNSQLTKYHTLQHFIMTPGYKGHGDFERRKIIPPSPFGGCWIKITPARKKRGIRQMNIEITPELSG